jgi:hypothetical protein
MKWCVAHPLCLLLPVLSILLLLVSLHVSDSVLCSCRVVGVSARVRPRALTSGQTLLLHSSLRVDSSTLVRMCLYSCTRCICVLASACSCWANQSLAMCVVQSDSAGNVVGSKAIIVTKRNGKTVISKQERHVLQYGDPQSLTAETVANLGRRWQTNTLSFVLEQESTHYAWCEQATRPANAHLTEASLCSYQPTLTTTAPIC